MDPLFNDLNRPVIIAVITVPVVQASIDKVIHVVAVRYCFVTAVGAVNVLRVIGLCSAGF